MVKPSDEPIEPTKDGLTLLPSGQILVELERPIGRAYHLRRPTFGEFTTLSEKYASIRDEIWAEFPANTPERHKAILVLGGRWLTHVLAMLAELDAEDEVDSVDVPAWTANAQELYDALELHWLTIPLASGPRSVAPADTPTRTATAPAPETQPAPTTLFFPQPNPQT